MKILSNFKDYYDHVAHLYGGGDPKCLYVRKRIVEREIVSGTSLTRSLSVTQKGIVKQPYTDYKDHNQFKWLAVCGKYYLLTYNSETEKNFLHPEWAIFSKDKHPDIWDNMSGRWSNRRAARDMIGEFSEPLLELSRKVNAPVFTFNNSYRSDSIDVDGEIPILGNLGFASVVDAQQIYQELSYFVGNVIKESPDLAPKTNMTDKEKILQHGFDLKKSFRHRV